MHTDYYSHSYSRVMGKTREFYPTIMHKGPDDKIDVIFVFSDPETAIYFTVLWTLSRTFYLLGEGN